LRGQNAAHEVTEAGRTSNERPDPLWVYVSTIGELNAIDPFLRRLLQETRIPTLTILTDHPHYRDSYLAKYPQARVCPIDHRSATVEWLIAGRAPALTILAEIPCLLSDAPCRLPFALLYELKRRGSAVCMINGWLYHGKPSCSMDALEKRLFRRDYPQHFDLMTVQDETTRDILIASGADPARVFVTGNIKFDAAAQTAWTPARSTSPALLKDLVDSERPVVVAGCVTNIQEQVLALDAWRVVLREIPQAVLVIAPRHPEVVDRMTKLEVLLQEREIAHRFKSRTGDLPLPADVSCLVLDTMGELRDFYAASAVSYVGLNHNVLEPMTYDKPVVVTPGWDREYPSFPVYSLLLDKHAIFEVREQELGETWLELLRDPGLYAQRRNAVRKTLESLRGATERDFDLLRRFGLLKRLSSTTVS
jgi:3-deoxy-D-manno-octulosonic-acid transferase